MKKLTRHKVAFIITLLVSLLLIVSTGYLFYNVLLLKNIEDVMRMIGIGIISIIVLLLLISMIKSLKKYHRVKLIIVILLSLIVIGGEVFVGYNIGKVYGKIKSITDNSEYTVYSSSIVTLKGNSAKTLSDVGDSPIGVLDDEKSIEGSIIPNEIIKKNNLTNKTEIFDSYISMIDALKNGDIDYIFLPTNYSIMFNSIEGYEDLNSTTKIIYRQNKKVKKEKDNNISKKSITEPFTILIMGVDSEEEGIEGSAFNGDSLMVITFNPETLNSTILSIPRDSYVPIACFKNQKQNKITHAAWQGESCMMKTIENLLDIKIDYFIKINFKGVIGLVDLLNGVDIDVPYSFCEQDSNRRWGKNTVYVREGKQTLNGEQALALARNRHPNPSMCSAEWTNYHSDDFVRGQQQQEIVKALLNKLKDVNDLNKMYKILDTISNNMSTNMSTEQILSLYNIFKDIAAKSHDNADMADLLGMQKLYLNGYGARIFDYGGMNLSLYNYVLYEDSIKAVSEAMKVNLGLKPANVIKTFRFSINNPFEEVVIGKNKVSQTTLVLLPSFIGKSLSSVNSFCSANGIKVDVKYITGSGAVGTVSTQSIPAGANVVDINTITVEIIEKSTSPIIPGLPEPENPDDTNLDDDDSEEPSQG